ncbi:MAG: diguanylate cyclase, partial [bacterium]|nr:diguanylate cyclase [bacterium]
MKRLKKLITNTAAVFVLILILMTYSPILLEAQKSRLKFSHIKVSDGLSQSSVQTILQDRNGFMWFGTQDGLNKYDGYTFTVYRRAPDNPASLVDNDVLSLCEDRSGTLWVGTRNGLSAFNHQQETFTSFRRKKKKKNWLLSNEIAVIFEDSSATLWLGTNNGGLCKVERNKSGKTQFISYKHEKKNPQSLACDTIWAIYEAPFEPGVLWVGTHEGLSRLSHDKDGNVVFDNYYHDPKAPGSLSNNCVVAILEDRKGTLWIGSDGGGLDSFDRNSKKFTHYANRPEDPGSISSSKVWHIFEDLEGTLWLGTYGGGLNRFDLASQRFVHYKNDPQDHSSLARNEIWTIYQDRSGVIWVGTDIGISKFLPSADRFHHYRRDTNDPGSLKDNDIWALSETRKGTLWVGTGSGLFRLDKSKPGQEVFVHYKANPDAANSLPSNEIQAMCESQLEAETLWIGTYGGLSRLKLKPNGKTVITNFTHEKGNPNSLIHDQIYCLLEDRSHDLWIGTYAGLSRLKQENGTVTFLNYKYEMKKKNGLVYSETQALYQDRSDSLWIGTSGGLSRMYTDPRGKTKFNNYRYSPKKPGSLCSDNISAIYEDSAGVLWIGTDQGINRFNREKKTFTHYWEKHGLSNSMIYGLLEDKRGHLWISTNKGLSVFNTQRMTFKNYDERDGVQSNEFNLGAYFKNTSGRMYFGGINGFNAFYPERIIDNPNIPQLAITDFQIFAQSVKPGPGPGARLNTHINTARELVLSYKDHVFSFEFAALDYRIPGKNLYAYKMENFDSNWNYTGNRRFAGYTNLDHGEYVFRVKGSNNDGTWNDKGISMKITIVPPFWKTLWFRTLVSLFLMALVYFLYKMRVKNIQSQKIRLQKLVDQQVEELKEANLELNRLAREDDLTQIYNHRTFMELLEKECKLAERNNLPVSIIMVDVDFFKIYNDSYGQRAGDDCLVRLAAILKNSVKRPSDFVARYGGAEFVVVIPGTDIDGVIYIARQIKKKIREAAIPFEKSVCSDYVTTSMGVSTFVPSKEYSSSILL